MNSKKALKHYARMIGVPESELQELVNQHLEMQKQGIPIQEQYRILEEKWKLKRKNN